ncbi:hypothetical protein ElyMa_002628700 [Elysia marginata]|uniref:Uncharacterized protein n=1 Tax=Elysia marginata TaxID=1093978 RepID=A0AAV4H3V5_9GAST|nr:hypothetical protein ElyMa_002628700 [Elysia marginata]
MHRTESADAQYKMRTTAEEKNAVKLSLRSEREKEGNVQQLIYRLDRAFHVPPIEIFSAEDANVWRNNTRVVFTADHWPRWLISHLGFLPLWASSSWAGQ